MTFCHLKICEENSVHIKHEPYMVDTNQVNVSNTNNVISELQQKND